ncbi:MAG: hypothetical protein HC923_13260 [Myxococcales bacterium]|nr:hypothetical protein [Myxococcales bacterium]
MYLHGFGSSPDGNKAKAILPALRAIGVPTRAPALSDDEDFFEFTVGRSITRSRRQLFDRTLLIGSSLGAWTGALLALEEPRIVQMILLAPAFRFADRWTRPERAASVAAWRANGRLAFEIGHPPAIAGPVRGVPRRCLRPRGQPEAAFEYDPVSRHTRRHRPPEGRAQGGGEEPRCRLPDPDDDHGLAATTKEVREIAVEKAQALLHSIGPGDR